MRISSLIANVSIVQALLENNDRPIVLLMACRDVFDHEATLGAGMTAFFISGTVRTEYRIRYPGPHTTQNDRQVDR